MTIDDLMGIIKENENCYFNFYKNECLYYSFFYNFKECLFPIPIRELGSTEMRFTIRTMNQLSYIRKALIDKSIIIKNIE